MMVSSCKGDAHRDCTTDLRSLSALHRIARRIILPQLKDATLAGDKMMVPLTESLYVEGYVHEKDKILVDIGTGYFAEVCTQNHALPVHCPVLGQSQQGVLCRETVSRP